MQVGTVSEFASAILHVPPTCLWVSLFAFFDITTAVRAFFIHMPEIAFFVKLTVSKLVLCAELLVSHFSEI